eukprot:m.215655 g.215655  ORF g.215655 m.215655 type:complete len:53 (+) comp39838_c1_seq10:74-232(+)
MLRLSMEELATTALEWRTNPVAVDLSISLSSHLLEDPSVMVCFCVVCHISLY